MTKPNRRPSRAEVARSLRELELLFRKPDPGNETAPVATEAAAFQNRQTTPEAYAPTGAKRKVRR